MTVSAFDVLERVELAARERRLAAASSADAITAAARDECAQISASVPARTAAALAELRADRARHVAADIAAIETRLAALDAEITAGTQPAGHAAAVALVVAAVLGEAD